jgi:hypothetical protein
VLNAILLLSLAGALPGDTLWLRSFDGTGSREDRPTGLHCDREGNVVAVGYSFGRGTDYDFLVVKYDSLGRMLWQRTYNSPLNSEDRAWASCLDSAGNIYVTGGSIVNPAANWDYVTIKYRPDGDTCWLRRYDSPFSREDKPAGIAVDDSGFVYVTGASRSAENSWDYLTIKYSAVGETTWTRRLDGVGHSDDMAAAVAFAADRGVIVTGKSYGIDRMPDIVTISYGTDGKTRWQQTYTGTGVGHDLANSLAIDGTGNAYVAGSVTNQGSSYDYLLLKYSPQGRLLWSRTYDGPGHRVDMVSGLKLDSRGDPVITGQSMGVGTSSDYATVKYSATGETLWVRRYNSPDNREDRAQALAVGEQDQVLVTGGSVMNGSFESYATVAYSAVGDTLWTRSYKADGDGDSRATQIALDRSHGLVVSGFAATQASGLDIVTVKHLK